MNTMEDIVRLKGPSAWILSPDSFQDDAIKRMVENRLGALLVLKAGNLSGILPNGDSAIKIFLGGKSLDDACLREIVDSTIFHTSLELAVEGCQVLTQETHIRHLPLLIEDFLVGTISMEDLARIMISEED